MRRFTLLFSALVLGTTVLKAQTVATFDTFTLAHADTFYANYSASGSDVGFNDGNAHFPCVYDTLFGGFWSYGFAYSNMTDSVTSGYMNQYSAITAKGYGGTDNYVVAYGAQNIVSLTGPAIGKVVSGFYVTNNTYAHNSMRDGDMFSRQFHNGDWFKLTVRGFSGGVLTSANVGVYLANFLHPDTTDNYILRDWEGVNLVPLGHVDSLEFSLTSSDNGMWGMNTPAYFCMDNLTIDELSLATAQTKPSFVAKVYPNPVANVLYIDVTDDKVQQVTVTDMVGRVIYTNTAVSSHMQINTATLPAGVYILQLSGNGNTTSVKFTKE